MKRGIKIGIIIASALAVSAAVLTLALFMARDKGLLRPMKTGVNLITGSHAEIDASNIAEGYILVRYTGGETGRVRVAITRTTDYLYELDSGGAWEIFPLTEGDGNYSVTVYEQIEGTRYRPVFTRDAEVILRHPLLPFLYPSKQVSFDANSQVYALAHALTAGDTTDAEKISTLFGYVVENLEYDYQLASDPPPNYLPTADEVLMRGSGMCLDYCVLLAAMLRSVGIPCRMEVGDARGEYHSWLMVGLDSEHPVRLDPAFTATAADLDEAAVFIADDNNYAVRFVY